MYNDYKVNDAANDRHFVSQSPLSLVALPDTKKQGFYHDKLKRVMDIAIVLLSAPVTLPVTLILAFLISRDGAPALFRQDRVGLNGSIFTCLKLRSMVPDADEKLDNYLNSNPEARDEWDKFQKLRNDPRITRVGQFIRRSSLDELPQLWNVLRGDMSIVGPRPFMPEQEDLYDGTAYYDFRPGITGVWQVSDHNETTFASRVGYDDHYAKTFSFWTDVKIMIKTVAVIFRARGV